MRSIRPFQVFGVLPCQSVIRLAGLLVLMLAPAQAATTEQQPMPPPLAAPPSAPRDAAPAAKPDAAKPDIGAPKPGVGLKTPDQAAPDKDAPPTLDDLFARLKAAKTPQESKMTQMMIDVVMLESGSDTIDLLMFRALSAIQNQDLPLALDLLDTIIALKPDYSEGWNKRATIFFLQRNYGKSISDLEMVLRLQPRHMSALTGLGTMLKEMGDTRHALIVLKQAHAIAPADEIVAKALNELTMATSGHDL